MTVNVPVNVFSLELLSNCECEKNLKCLRYFEHYGPWAGTARGLGRASQAGTARKKAHRAVPGPEAKHEARSGTAREARRPVSARCLSGRASPTSCRAGLGRAGPLAIYRPTYVHPTTCPPAATLVQRSPTQRFVVVHSRSSRRASVLLRRRRWSHLFLTPLCGVIPAPLPAAILGGWERSSMAKEGSEAKGKKIAKEDDEGIPSLERHLEGMTLQGEE